MKLFARITEKTSTENLKHSLSVSVKTSSG